MKVTRYYIVITGRHLLNSVFIVTADAGVIDMMASLHWHWPLFLPPATLRRLGSLHISLLPFLVIQPLLLFGAGYACVPKSWVNVLPLGVRLVSQVTFNVGYKGERIKWERTYIRGITLLTSGHYTGTIAASNFLICDGVVRGIYNNGFRPFFLRIFLFEMWWLGLIVQR